MRLQRPHILDIEASGFGPNSYPIEIGIVLADGTQFCTLIAPMADWTHWTQEAESIHGISRKMLSKHGKPVTEVATKLNDLLAGKTLYSDGWVVDKPWIIRLFFAARQPMEFALSPLEMILSEPQMEAWSRCKKEIIKESEGKRHRASFDAWVIQETYFRTFKANSK